MKRPTTRYKSKRRDQPKISAKRRNRHQNFESNEFPHGLHRFVAMAGSLKIQPQAQDIPMVSGRAWMQPPYTGRFLAVSGGARELTVEYLESLSGDATDLLEDERINPALLDRTGFVEYLTGNGSRDHTIALNRSTSHYDNSLGAQEVDVATTGISNVRILFENTKAPAGSSLGIGDLAEGKGLEFFLMQDVEDSASGSNDTLVFNFGAAVLILCANGSKVHARIFHLATPICNSDGIEDVRSDGSSAGDALCVGIEDLAGGGDLDCQATVLLVYIAGPCRNHVATHDMTGLKTRGL